MTMISLYMPLCQSFFFFFAIFLIMLSMNLVRHFLLSFFYGEIIDPVGNIQKEKITSDLCNFQF